MLESVSELLWEKQEGKWKCSQVSDAGSEYSLIHNVQNAEGISII